MPDSCLTVWIQAAATRNQVLIEVLGLLVGVVLIKVQGMFPIIRNFKSRDLLTFGISTLLLQVIFFAFGLLMLSRLSAQHSNEDPNAPSSVAALSGSIKSTKSQNVSTDKPLRQPKFVPVDYEIKPGDTWARIWLLHGGTVEGARNAQNQLDKLDDKGPVLRAGETIRLSLSRDGDIAGLRKRERSGKIFELRGNSVEGYSSRLGQARIVEQKRFVGGVITSSLSAAADDADIPYSIVDDMVDFFGTKIDFRKDLQPGDSFAVLYTDRRLKDGTELEQGPIEAVSIELSGKLYAVVRYVGADGTARYYDENGEALGNYFLRYPLQFTRISSIFTNARFHPVLGVNRPHHGVDFAAATGTPVRTIGDGVVSFAGFRSSTGNMIKIQHNERWSTVYMHLSKIETGVKTGARVQRGQKIGAVGMTGLATGPHLHFEVHEHDDFVDPIKANLGAELNPGETVPAEFLQVQLQKLRAQHQTILMASASNAGSPQA